MLDELEETSDFYGDVPKLTLKEMWNIIENVHNFPDDFVKAIEWAIKTTYDKKKNPKNTETMLNNMIGNLASFWISKDSLKPAVDENYYRLWARAQILIAWCTCIARAKSRDARRNKKDRHVWRKQALWGIPITSLKSWRMALKYKSPLLFPPSNYKNEASKKA